MRDILPTLLSWPGRRFALAWVVGTWGSSPRPVGSAMGVREDGVTCGSVSGGCVETAVTEAALQALREGLPKKLVFDRISDEDVWRVGLSCGGRIEVWIDPDPTFEPWPELVQRLGSGQPATLALCLDPLEKALVEERPQDGREWFLHSFPRRERLVIVGAAHIAQPLIEMARTLGLWTVLVDPRAALLDPERLVVAPDEAICGWPVDALPGLDLDEQTYAVTLSHDPKIDLPALEILLRSPARYIGALGSRTTQGKMRAGLEERGLDASSIARVHGPVGLDLGAKTPQEIALSILAEIVKVRRAG